MTSERPRFPIVLTLLAAVAFAIMVGLGAWQLQRAAWKDKEVARITALQHAAPAPIAPVLAQAAAGEDVTFTPVIADCTPAPPAPVVAKMTVAEGDWVARVSSPCALAAPPYDGVMVDRGLLDASHGHPEAPTASLPAPVHVTGVLFPRTTRAAASLQHPAAVILVVQSEAPAAPGVTPTPYPGAAAEQLQYVGSYWITWFGLAGALAAIYAAVLWRRYHPKQ
jgi:surfeit locus 1 family protein